MYLSKESLEIINNERKENGETLFQNCRNAAAGSVRNLDPNITKQRQLRKTNTCHREREVERGKNKMGRGN